MDWQLAARQGILKRMQMFQLASRRRIAFHSEDEYRLQALLLQGSQLLANVPDALRDRHQAERGEHIHGGRQ